MRFGRVEVEEFCVHVRLLRLCEKLERDHMKPRFMNVRVWLLATMAYFSLLLDFVLAETARELRIGMITPPAHVWNQEAAALGSTLRESSQGRLSSVVFPSGQLGTEQAMVQQLQTGALDMAWITTAEIANRVPAFGALHAPFLVRDIAHAEKLLKTPEVQGLLEPLAGQIGAVGLGFAMTGMRQMLARDSVGSLADLKGKKVRIIPSAPIRDFFSLAGLVPTPMSLPAVFEALANGHIEAIDMDYESIINNRYHDLSKTMLVSNHQMFPMVALLSVRTWRVLSDEDRQLVRTATRKHLDQTISRFVAEEGEKLRRLDNGRMEIRSVGVEFFGGAVAEWDALWSRRAPNVSNLRAAAARL